MVRDTEGSHNPEGDDLGPLQALANKLEALKDKHSQWEEQTARTIVEKNTTNHYDMGVYKHVKRALQHSAITTHKSPQLENILQAAYQFVKVAPVAPTKGTNKDSSKYMKPEQKTIVEMYLGALMSAGALKETNEQQVMQHTGAPIENPLFLKEDSENGDWDFRVILDARSANKYVKWDKTAAIALKRLIPLMREKQNIAAHLKKTQIGSLKYHTKLDLLGAYYQMRLPDHIKYYTTFRWKNQLYCFNTMPYGMGIASSVLNVLTKYLLGRIWQQMENGQATSNNNKALSETSLGYLTQQIHTG